MTIELGGMLMLLDVRGNPVLYVGDVLAIYSRWESDENPPAWTKPWIVTQVLDDSFTAKQPFVDNLGQDSLFMFGHVAVKLLARGGLKTELRHRIWQSVQADPRWRGSTHRNRKAIAKKLFWEIWDSTEDKESLAQGLDWLGRKRWDSSET